MRRARRAINRRRPPRVPVLRHEEEGGSRVTSLQYDFHRARFPIGQRGRHRRRLRQLLPGDHASYRRRVIVQHDAIDRETGVHHRGDDLVGRDLHRAGDDPHPRRGRITLIQVARERPSPGRALERSRAQRLPVAREGQDRSSWLATM